MKHFPQITAILLLLLVHIPLHATPDPCEFQQVAEEICQSVLERSIQMSSDEIKWAIWDIADGISMDGLKQFFPKECRDFKVKGFFRKRIGMNVVQTWFTYAGFSFSCVFHADFNTSLLEKIVLYKGDEDDDKYRLWTLCFSPLAEKENLNSN